MSTLELPALYVDSVALVVTAPRLVLVNRDPSPGETGVPIDSTVAAKTAVLSDLPGGEVVAGIPAQPMKRWRRMVAIQARLPELWRRVMGGAGPTEGDRE